MPIDQDYLDRMVDRGDPGPIAPFCANCGYNMTGAVSNRCPECGHVFDPVEWKQRAQAFKQQMTEAREAAEWARYALLLGLGTLVVALICQVVPLGCFAALIRIGTLIAGVAATLLGLGVFRVQRPPAQVAEESPLSSGYLQAVGAIILGVAGVMLAAVGPW